MTRRQSGLTHTHKAFAFATGLHTLPTLGSDVKMSAPLYAPEQIVIPSGLPDVLKQFTKSAIKTQPVDLYKWAAGECV
jgi:hypothetical protein